MNNPKLTFDAIRELHRKGHLKAAKAGYLALLRKNPRDVETLHALGILHAQEENYAEAVKYFQKALKIRPQNTMVSLHLANILKFQGLFSQSIQVLKEILVIEPHCTPALNNLGTVYYAQEKWDEAITCFRHAIQQAADYVDAYYNLGLALDKQQDFAGAIEAYQQLLVLAPEHFAAQFHLACAYMHTNEMDPAINAFLQIEMKYPNHFETQTNLATCYLKKGKLNEAKFHYGKALELNPHDTQILFNLGVIHMQLGQIDFAIQNYQRALQTNPNDFAVHNNLGVAFLAKPHAGFALQHFREALRIQPNNVAIQHTLKILSEQQPLLSSPPEYIKSLFDSYADHYEPHLLTALDYKVPELLLNALKKNIRPHHYAILDLGCGTGLCGAAFHSLATTLTGVDLSPKMLEIAAQKNIYTALIEKDLIEFLVASPSHYDLVIAGDVLVYHGDLSSIFSGVKRVLNKDGVFVFNTEICLDEKFKMNQSGRFGHHKNYIEELAKQHGFKIIYQEMVPTRLQNNEPVLGYLFILSVHFG